MSRLSNPISNSFFGAFRLAYLTLVLILFTQCSSVKQLAVEKDISSILKNSEVFSQHFTGFSLFDIDQNRYIADYNSTLRFTPASNGKILTMYVTLKSFSDSLPALLIENGDLTRVRPIGDPTFLNPSFGYQPTYEYLSKLDSFEISWPESEIRSYGNGWAWDDYLYAFQPQRSWWPIYGNTVNISKEDSTLSINPPFFQDFVDVENGLNTDESVERDPKYNLFKAYLNGDTTNFDKNIPFEYSTELLLQLLNDTLKSDISFSNTSFKANDTLSGFHIDTVLAAMMKPSDNFLAEQLLILSAWRNDFEDIDQFIEYAKTVWLPDLNDHVWVDGSGLSRYNLIAPVDQVRLLRKSYEEFGWDRVTNIMPTGGQGTLKELYLSEDPFIFAKTGTLSNNHNLSGYLITRSGKRLIFSLMNNHYTRPTAEIKKAMEKFLIQIRDSY